MKVSRLFVVLCAGALAACVSTDPSAPVDGETGSSLAITVGALDLRGVGRAEYTISVSNGAGLVWTRAGLDSDTFGDGVGALSYVGPCDASSPAHTVTLLLTALYDDSAALIPATTYRNPTPVSVPATCQANADTAVDINLTILRDAQQGFFDIAVDFDDVFCSAKLDCEDDEENDLHLLHRPGGARDTTVVLGFACTGGAEAGVDTHLYLDDLVVTCTNATYSATVDPSGGPGNVSPGGNAGGLLFGAAVYRGDELIGNSAYWNVALGLDRSKFAAAGTCTLTTSGTASDGPFTGSRSPADTAWPVIEWNVEFVAAADRACTFNPINVTGSGVQTTYTGLGPGRLFGHGYQHGGTGTSGPAGCGPGCAITAVSPAGVSTAGGDTVTLTGAFSASDPTCADCELQLMPGGSALPATFDVAGGTVTFAAPAGTSGEVRLIVGLDVVPHVGVEVVGGQLVPFSRTTIPIPYAAPVVTSVSGCLDDVYPVTAGCQISGGEALTISGANFGASAGGISVTVGGAPCSGVAVAVDHTTITCALGFGSGFDHELVVTVAGRSGALAGAVSYLGPVIQGVTCAGCAAGPDGTLLLEPGSGELAIDTMFAGGDEGAITVTYGDGAVNHACTSVAFAPGSTTQLRCTPAAYGIGARMKVVVDVAGQQSRPSAPVLSYPAPVIVSGTLGAGMSTGSGFVTGSLNGGEWLTFSAQHVGSDPTHLVVRYGPSIDPERYTCASVVVTAGVAPTSHISCLTVAGTGNHYFQVTAAGQVSNIGVDMFSYPVSPVVTSVGGCPSSAGAATTDCPTAGGVTLMVSGQSFNATSAVWVGAQPCPGSTYQSPTFMTCVLPPGSGDASVTVRDGALISVPLAGISFAAPSVTSVSGCVDIGSTTYDCAPGGGGTITIEGANFGSSGAVVTVGGALCGAVVHDGTNAHGQLTCALPAGGGLNAEVRVDNGRVSAPGYLSYAP